MSFFLVTGHEPGVMKKDRLRESAVLAVGSARGEMTGIKPAEFSAECRVGRLVEARLCWVNDAVDVQRFREQMQLAFEVAGDSVICADWRRAVVLPPS